MKDSQPSILSKFLTWLPLIMLVGLPFVLDLGALASTSSSGTLAAAQPSFLENLMPVGILLVVITVVLMRLPKTDVGHTAEYRKRRVLNWLPLGLTYMFLYMGRYNLTVAKSQFGALMDMSDFSVIFAVGTVVYGASFIINGPLTDRYGGRRTILISAIGSGFSNFGMGLVTLMGWTDNLTLTFSILYGINMYFQSFGAVSIVKVNAPWFHVKERGTFGAIFGILISLGIFFAYDVGRIIVANMSLEWVFLIPAIALFLFAFFDYLWVRDSPADAGLKDFDLGDAKLGNEGQRLPVWQVFKLMFSQQAIVIIALIEFCSGFLRQSIMQYGYLYADETGRKGDFVFANWGIFLCCAGILGGMFAGIISDKLFDSRRGPVAAVLYAMMLAGSVVTVFTYETSLIGPLVIFMSMAVIGVHGMLSGTASMDFGGRQNTGVAVGLIDGFVYLGTATMALINSIVLPSAKTAEAKIASNWEPLFIAMIPVAMIGLLLSLRVWNARPTKGKSGGH